ncbi:unnamed protein product [Ceratitis capitata]|uniref:(Mediterranean fruit fly) hypothetical protein n=1 Tax=Ceratitis capitata TaxID=7213 RepID=A0A811UN02_CERCA|nr:unnamed protein product [Ceratitis capitata]
MKCCPTFLLCAACLVHHYGKFSHLLSRHGFTALAYATHFAHFAYSVPPDILDYPTSTDMVIREGSNVTLKCAAVGSPTPTITWRREGGEPIPLPNNSEGKTSDEQHIETSITNFGRYDIFRYILQDLLIIVNRFSIAHISAWKIR